MKKNNQGITLLEMTIVVIIISVIFLLSVPSIQKTLSVVNHKGCKAIEKVADEFITECSMNNGNYDNIHDCKYRIPDYWDIGEVYERLIEDCFSDDEILHGIWKVYHSWISDKISNYNTDFYYQPRDYIAACYEEGDVL